MVTDKEVEIFAGVIICLVFWFYFRPRGRKSPTFQNILTKTSRSREFLSLLCNLLIIEIGTVISLVTLGGTEVNTVIQNLYTVIWITVGFAIGTFIVIIYEAIHSIIENRANKNKTVGDSELSNKDIVTNKPSPISLNLTGDISKMNTEQLKTTRHLAESLQDRKPKDKQDNGEPK